MQTERSLNRLWVYLLMLAVSFTFMTGYFEWAWAEKPRYGGILKTTRGNSPRAPGWPSSSGGLDITDFYPCLEPLTKINEKGEPYPFLASSWEYGPDLKSLTIAIRKGVKFHDGSELNAEVVKMNLEERKGGLNGWELASIKSIDVIDEYTVRLNLSEFKNVLLESLANYNGLMISPKVIEKAKTKKGQKWAKKNPVGTGPFKFVKFVREVILKYERFDDYWQKGMPYLDGIEIHYIKEKMTSMASLKVGEVHALWDSSAKNAFALQKEGFRVIQYPGSMRAIVGDSNNPKSIFANQKVREAIEYAIDRKAITESLGYGFWEPVNQYSSSKCNGYNPDFIGRPYNPDKARQLLKEAGYPNGFKTKMIVNPVTEPRDVMAAMQRNLLKVGIDVKLEFADGGKYYYSMLKGWKDGLLVFGQNSPINLTQELNSLYQPNAARFPVLYRPLDLQEVLAKAETVPEHETQISLVKKAIRIMSEKAVVIPLWSKAEVIVLHHRFHNPGFSAGRRGQWTPGGAWISK